jgi:signal transduction histidine kinase
MPRLGWLLFAATCACAVAQGLLVLTTDVPLWSYQVMVDEGFPLVTIGSVLGAAVGALIIGRYPRNPVGWLFAAGQLGNQVGQLASALIFHLSATGRRDAIPDALLVGAQLFNAVYTMTFLALIYLLAPDGRVPNRRWRFTPLVPIGALLLEYGVVLAIPPSDYLLGESAEFSWVTIAVALLGNAGIGVAIALGAAAVWSRLRSATGEARAQLLWLAASGAALTGGFLLALVSQFLLVTAPWYLIVPWYLSYIFVSISVGIAILRYRLYDIDIILSRAILLATLGVFVTVGYIGIVVGIGSLLSALGAAGTGLFWPSLVATALVAAAFQPLRRRMLRWIDRLVYGERAAPYEALADLSRELADRPTPDALPALVAETAGRAVGAVRAVATVGATSAPLITQPWVRPGAAGSGSRFQVHEVPVTDQGDQVGGLSVELPAGRGLRPFEQSLLIDIGRQAGVAFRGALLEAEVAQRIRQIETFSAELADSRRRLLRAENEARERFAADIDHRVLPLQTDTRHSLAGVRGVAGLTDRLPGAIAAVEAALEELRAVVRGVFPALLERRGLVPALISELGRSAGVTLELGGLPDDRLDRDVEAAAYLCCVEVAPRDRPCVVRLAVLQATLTIDVVADDASGPAGSPDRWQHVHDRLAALDGTLSVTVSEGKSIVLARIPLSDQPPEPGRAIHTASSLSGPNAALGT